MTKNNLSTRVQTQAEYGLFSSKRSKKAILLPETLKIIIAVICIVLLIYLAVSLYGIFIGKSEIERARATLDAIVGKLNSIEKDGDMQQYLVTAPVNWRIISFFEDKNKICICPQEKEPLNQKNICLEQGICQETSFNTSINSVCTFNDQETYSLFNGAVEHCLSLVTLPKSIILQRINKQSFLLKSSDDKTGIISSDSFLDFRSTKEETIKDMILVYISHPENESNKKLLGATLDQYILKNFKGYSWNFEISSDNKNILTLEPDHFLGGEFAKKYSDIKSSLNVNNKNYDILFQIGVWESPAPLG